MKNAARALTVLLICLAVLCPSTRSLAQGDNAIGIPAEELITGFSMGQIMDDDVVDDADPQEEDGQEPLPAQDEQPEQEPVQYDEQAEPTVRWTYSVSLTALQSPYLMIVNADHMLDKDYEPSPMVKMTMVKRATSATVYLEEAAAQAVQDMFQAASEVSSYTYVHLNRRGTEEVEETAKFPDGMTLFLKSGYRAYGTQATTYANYLARNNGVDGGEVAQAGASEHQSGLCCDILNSDYAARDEMTQDFKYTPEAQWLKENCVKFGMILRYPEDKEAETGSKFEPWHFRYVGKEVAGYLTSTGLTFEEFTEEWQKELEEFEAKGGDVAFQMAYEENRRNAPPASYILNEYGSDGDAEISLVY